MANAGLSDSGQQYPQGLSTQKTNINVTSFFSGKTSDTSLKTSDNVTSFSKLVTLSLVFG